MFVVFGILIVITAKNQLEFCCHVLRGTIDPKEPAVYEHVKFTGNFKSLNDGEPLVSLETGLVLSAGEQNKQLLV